MYLPLASSKQLLLTLTFLLAVEALALAQPIHVAPLGKDSNAGTETEPVRTVQAGVNKAQAGDTVFVHRGVYRERITFPRNGEPGKPITLAGEPGAIIDGGSILSGWEKVAGAGNVYRAAYTGQQPANLTWNNRYILRIRNEFMASDGMAILRGGPDGAVIYGGPRQRSWDGAPAMWGTLDGYVYIGFGEAGIDAAKEELTVAPQDRHGGAAITIDGRKFITIDGLTIRNGYAAIVMRRDSSDCIIEHNTLIGGWHTVETLSGSSRVQIRNNDITLGYPHSLSPGDPRHWFIWTVFKKLSDYDRVCVNFNNVGSDNEVAENRLHDSFDGVENEGSGQRLNVHDNIIETMADDGLEPDGEETDSSWHDNLLRDCSICFRHKSISGAGPMYVYQNRFLSGPESRYGAGMGIYLFSGTSTTSYIYHNTIVTQNGVVFGSTRVQDGLPNLWIVNNLFSCSKVFPDNRAWMIHPHFENNYCSGDAAEGLPWWGESNKIGLRDQAWEGEIKLHPEQPLRADSPARSIGIDLSQPWTIAGQTNPPLAGMAPHYFSGPRPDAGAEAAVRTR